MIRLAVKGSGCSASGTTRRLSTVTRRRCLIGFTPLRRFVLLRQDEFGMASFFHLVVPCAQNGPVKVLQANGAKKMIRRWHIKDILVGLLAMLMSVIALAIILVVVLFIHKREIATGPVYFLIPVLGFATGFYWSLRRSARPKTPPKRPSNFTIIVKSTAVGIAAIVLSVIAYFAWIWTRIPRDVGVGSVSFDVHALLPRPLLLTAFAAGFVLEYLRGSRRRSRLLSGSGE
jgi:hypothetical protein